ncbi:MAG TPA: Gfo/Idh/MocA family oxidoreductase [Opitutaceae bacterium]|nr:Gfo/Idh/MocA family oxidoreductase [Opitutaceae bacterium]
MNPRSATTHETPRKIRIGIIGCGKISDQYFDGLRRYTVLDVVACADLDADRARAKATERGVRAETVEGLLAAPDIDLVVNLTIPAAHAQVNRDALIAGKHVYCEKPFALNMADGSAVASLAQERGLLVGCAPDTFLGGGQQTARDAVDRGIIGRPLSAMAFFQSAGHESWHPSPEFYYKRGGGPMFDMGPYYITALVNFFGAARAVTAVTGRAFDERPILSDPLAGQMMKVEVPTHYSATVEFASGAIATLVMSFDAHPGPALPRIALFGDKGTLEVPDPNRFDGDTTHWALRKQESQRMPHTHTIDRGRGSGVADMAYSILRPGRPHRASGELALHVLEIMEASDRSGATARRVELTTTCKQPAALPGPLAPDELDA